MGAKNPNFDLSKNQNEGERESVRWVAMSGRNQLKHPSLCDGTPDKYSARSRLHLSYTEVWGHNRSTGHITYYITGDEKYPLLNRVWPDHKNS